jgi:hypothetical protein
MGNVRAAEWSVRSLWASVARTLILLAACGGTLQAHSGPPFPIVTDQQVGAYRLTIWTDPDATDDQTAAGRFWVTLDTEPKGRPVPASTQVTVSIRPLDRTGAARTARTGTVNGDVRRQYTALMMDHEGRYGVHVAVDGTLGKADLDAYTDATYDLRPRPILMVLFVMPFLLVGFVWGKLLIKRRGKRA